MQSFKQKYIYTGHIRPHPCIYNIHTTNSIKITKVKIRHQEISNFLIIHVTLYSRDNFKVAARSGTIVAIVEGDCSIGGSSCLKETDPTY